VVGISACVVGWPSDSWVAKVLSAWLIAQFCGTLFVLKVTCGHRGFIYHAVANWSYKRKLVENILGVMY